ncbi:MAG: nucleotidyltransferase family protein [Paracoccaceae bacterium]|nr:nucleotidyltransferase family protein [Paracoccaceae bacterium]
MKQQAPSDLPIIVLAAGQSQRMRGVDKLLEEVDGRPLLRRQANLACNVTTGPVLAALPPSPHPRYQCLDALGVNRIPVPNASEGMNATIRTAIRALPPDAPGVMVLLGDLPELTEDDLRAVLQSVDLTSETLIWRGATQADEPGHPIVFSKALFDSLSCVKGDCGAQSVVRAAGGRVKLVRLPDRRARMDLDTPEEWAAWRAARTS